MKKIIFVCILTMLIYSVPLNAQAGAAAAPFLLISPDARSSGMGDVGTAIADDINAVFWNPGGLGFLKKTGISKKISSPYFEGSDSYSKWLPQFNADLFYFTTAQGLYVKQLNGFIAINYTYINIDKFTGTDENGKSIGDFSSDDYSIGLAYGTLIGDNLGIGIQLKYIKSKLYPLIPNEISAAGGDGSSYAFDIGMLWKPQIGLNSIFLPKGCLNFGFNIQNLGPKIDYEIVYDIPPMNFPSNESEPLPTNLRFGTSINLLHGYYSDLKFAVDFSKLLVYRKSLITDYGSYLSNSDPLPKSLVTAWKNPGMAVAMGLEYWFSHFAAFRTGYFTEPLILGNKKYINLGLGLRYSIITADFSYIMTTVENHSIPNTMRFTLKIGGPGKTQFLE